MKPSWDIPIWQMTIKQIIDSGKKTSPKLKPLNSELQGLVLEVESDKKLSDLIISTEIKDRINRVVREFTHRNKLLSYNLENRRKILFSGPPGTGKTMSASIIANELHLPIYVILMDKVVTKYMGETSAKLRQIFDLIVDRPAVYLFDEFDAIGSQRGKDNDVGEMRRVLNSFLQFLERDNSESLIIAATNNLRMLDQALFRRFDDVIHYNLPTDEEKTQLLKSRLGKNVTSKDMKILLPMLENLSHAEINQACLDAIKESVLNNTDISLSLIEKTIKERTMAYKI